MPIHKKILKIKEKDYKRLKKDFGNYLDLYEQNDNFYIIGNNDLDTLKYQRKQELFPHNNVFNTYNNKKKLGEKYHHSGWKTPLEYLNKNSINIDYGIIAFGSVLPRNVPNKTYTKSGTIAKPLDRAVKYVAPYVNVLNELGIDWVSLVDDPRHFSVKMLDLFNKPKIKFVALHFSIRYFDFFPSFHLQKP